MTTDAELSLLAKIDLARNLASKWQTPIKHRRDLYNLNHYPGLGQKKDGETRYNDPTYTNTVDLAVGILHSNDFRWHAYGWSPSYTDTQDSSSIEKYLAGTLHVNSLREEEDIRLEVTQHFVRDGVACLYTVWDPKEAKIHRSTIDEVDPEAEEGIAKTPVYLETPVVVKVIDPLNIYLLPGGNNRWNAIMRSQSMTVYDIEHMYDDLILKEFAHLPAEDKMVTNIEYIDYWEIERMADTGKYIVRNARVADREVIRPLTDMKGYQHLPYTIGFYENNSSSAPENWVKTIIDVLEDSVKMMEEGINRRQAMIERFTGLPLLLNAKPGRNVQLDSSMHVTKLEDGEDLRFPIWPGNPPDVDAQLEFFRGRVQQSGFSESMYGSASGLAGSGYAISQETDQNRIRLTQPVTNLQLFWTQWAKKVISLTEAFAQKSKVRVYGKVRGADFVTLVPGKDMSSYLVECRIRPDFPTEKTRKHAMATQVANILSQETLMSEYLDIEQPDDEKKRKLIEMAQQHPAAQQYAIMLNLMQLAKDGDEAAGLALEIVKSQLPQPATGQGAPSPMQTPGMPSAGGGLTPQEQGQLPPGQGPAAQSAQMAGAAPNMSGMV